MIILLPLSIKKMIKKRSKISLCCKKLTSLLFSHIGLLILVLIYMITGCFLFQMLEENAGKQQCHEGAGIEAKAISKYREKIFNFIYKFSHKM